MILFRLAQEEKECILQDMNRVYAYCAFTFSCFIAQLSFVLKKILGTIILVNERDTWEYPYQNVLKIVKLVKNVPLHILVIACHHHLSFSWSDLLSIFVDISFDGAIKEAVREGPVGWGLLNLL